MSHRYDVVEGHPVGLENDYSMSGIILLLLGMYLEG